MDAGRVIAVFVVDDDSAVREGIVRLLGGTPDEFRIVGSAGSVAEAMRVVDAPIEIDVAVVDLVLPDGHGADVIARVVDTRPDAAPLVLSVLGDDESIFRALRAGARGYLLKDATPDEVLEAVRHAWTGGVPMTKEVARRIVSSFRPGPAEKRAGLTAREREVLELLCHGSSYAEIGGMLGIGTGTVHSHVKSIYRKLDVTSKTEAAKVAVQQRLFVP